jgi:tetratricopeptide (TPR) repeat protein
MSKKTSLIGFMCLIAVLYVAFNILASQSLSPLFFKLVEKPTIQDAAHFAHLIKNQPEYKNQISYFTEGFGQDFTSEMQKNSQIRKKEITILQGKLKTNPSSRDLLVELAIAYYTDKDLSEAKKTYLQAKKLDPTLHIPELEII